MNLVILAGVCLLAQLVLAMGLAYNLNGSSKLGDFNAGRLEK